jgi:Protein of unknown function (DUF3309)
LLWLSETTVEVHRDSECTRRRKMLGTVLLVILILALLGSVPVYPYSAQWGYFPSGIIGTVLIVWLILVLIGRV